MVLYDVSLLALSPSLTLSVSLSLPLCMYFFFVWTSGCNNSGTKTNTAINSCVSLDVSMNKWIWQTENKAVAVTEAAAVPPSPPTTTKLYDFKVYVAAYFVHTGTRVRGQLHAHTFGAYKNPFWNAEMCSESYTQSVSIQLLELTVG